MGLNQLTKIIQLIGLLIHINKYQPRVFNKKTYDSVISKTTKSVQTLDK
jgi:hypothetical protein